MKNYTSLYFIGAGGIGMSALVRYFLAKGYRVAGYDRTPSPLTEALQSEGLEIVYDESVALIPDYCRDAATTLVVYTPAIPATHAGLVYFREQGFKVVKRAELLGLITQSSKGLCFSGTHGKTTTSSMAAHIFHESPIGCNAFLGGILRNYNSNLILSDHSPFTVIEADEYDRSFHWLHPYMAVVTATDPDHLDIYGTEEAYLESFAHFTSLIQPGGCLVIKKGIKLVPRVQEGVKVYTYSACDGGDFHAENIRVGNGTIVFDFVAPDGVVADVELGVPVDINIENAVAAMAIARLNGVADDDMRRAMASFKGAKRRFEFWVKRNDRVMIDDYAHHPDELKASIRSVRALYPGRKLTVIFQPHLYSRTRDFAPQFAEALSMANQVILLDIYPAREQPIPGVTSQLIFDKITCRDKELCLREKLLERIKECNFDILLTMGAGDIDRLLPQIASIVEAK
ncbi:UDP-N-acetylmuramate--L-alanine ligase [Barnesiella sp. An55]|uniref:UDP-N-acetylmuramate--L-alanine ligase n=1 Tax=Barnesiella sp. An55 TaxID=1965646 RepID=UPI000B3AE59E|nr:UDP-N-acetylmuramate--L-alanine ligase [Barnesiella sp. An55]OUN69736.1 UDP-N-acetylmuramate--L-alanine ligase [Barnesiella sp. An55]HIZ25580.1 UDP-N-acetylmuramate--L-alanine ligase [Candidatus Barnesiella merdipullorum]